MVCLQEYLVLGMVAILSRLSPVTPLSSTHFYLVGGHPRAGGLAIDPTGSMQLPVPYRNTRQHSFMHAVQARAADMDDRQSITAVEEESTSSVETVPLVVVDGTENEMNMMDLTQKLLNGVFLATCFGWAAYTILTIDAGMTRGWTQSEIAMRIPLDNWSNYESSLMEKPIFTKTLINVVIYLLGDWLSQTVFQKKNVLDFDVSRTLKNGFIGLCFGPLVHSYYQFSDYILPVEEGLATRIQKILMDQTIYLSVKCSIYIAAVGLLSGDDWETCQQTVKEKIGGIVITAWKFWPLVHCATYSVIPSRHRILWVNCVDLIWNAILATQAQKDQPQTPETVKLLEGSSVGDGDSSLVETTSSDNHSCVVGVEDVSLTTNGATKSTIIVTDEEVTAPVELDDMGSRAAASITKTDKEIGQA